LGSFFILLHIHTITMKASDRAAPDNQGQGHGNPPSALLPVHYRQRTQRQPTRRLPPSTVQVAYTARETKKSPKDKR
tara:strand:- start:22571 stop:22801 length:231 start_codon:yes stop_codon:yes gene_type:complete